MGYLALYQMAWSPMLWALGPRVLHPKGAGFGGGGGGGCSAGGHGIIFVVSSIPLPAMRVPAASECTPGAGSRPCWIPLIFTGALTADMIKMRSQRDQQGAFGQCAGTAPFVCPAASAP